MGDGISSLVEIAFFAYNYLVPATVQDQHFFVSQYKGASFKKNKNRKLTNIMPSLHFYSMIFW